MLATDLETPRRARLVEPSRRETRPGPARCALLARADLRASLPLPTVWMHS